MEKIPIGFPNLGNTCWLNATVQCITHCQWFRDWFLLGDFKASYNKKNNILDIFYHLVNTIYGDYDPKKAQVGIQVLLQELFKHDKRFKPGQQMDSHDCILTIIDLLHQNVKREMNHKRGLPLEPQEKDWYDHLSYEESDILSIFNSQVVHTIQNKKENSVTKRYNVVNTFFLDIPNGLSQFSVIDSLKDFQTFKQIDGQNIFTQNDFFRIAPIFMISFMHQQALPDQVRFRLNNSFTIAGYTYNLVSILLHIGNDFNGHYISICKHNNKWYRYDDSNVSELDDNLLSQPFVFLPTLLFYERQK